MIMYFLIKIFKDFKKFMYNNVKYITNQNRVCCLHACINRCLGCC